jgi:aspartate oxidase
LSLTNAIILKRFALALVAVIAFILASTYYSQAGIPFPHYNDSVYPHTENVNIIGKTSCGLDCKKRLKKTAKKAEKRP